MYSNKNIATRMWLQGETIHDIFVLLGCSDEVKEGIERGKSLYYLVKSFRRNSYKYEEIEFYTNLPKSIIIRIDENRNVDMQDVTGIKYKILTKDKDLDGDSFTHSKGKEYNS